jgi:four helix bundle protein
LSKIERFEDLRIWGRARDAVHAVYQMTVSGAFCHDYPLRDQIRRAAISMPSNIAEGFSRRSNKEFVQFLFIAKGSAAEVQSQLHIALDQHYITQQEFDRTYGEVDVLARQISRFITYLKGVG